MRTTPWGCPSHHKLCSLTCPRPAHLPLTSRCAGAAARAPRGCCHWTPSTQHLQALHRPVTGSGRMGLWSRTGFFTIFQVWRSHIGRAVCTHTHAHFGQVLSWHLSSHAPASTGSAGTCHTIMVCKSSTFSASADCFNQPPATQGRCRAKGMKTLVYFMQCEKKVLKSTWVWKWNGPWIPETCSENPLTSVSSGYTTLVLHSRVWQEIHDLCSWDKLFSALSTTSGMWSVIILGLIKMLLKTVSFDHLAVYLISEEHHLKQNTP